MVKERVDSSIVQKIRSRQARVAVLGLGFVGLAEAVAIAKSGLSVVGIDIDENKANSIKNGHSFTMDVHEKELQLLLKKGSLGITTDFDPIRLADCVIICVPTPITVEGQADNQYIRTAARCIAERLDTPKLVVLESTCPPGTTRNLVLPILEATGARVGQDFFLAFAPDRIDPGSDRFNIKNTTRLVAGITPRCIECACTFYSSVVERVEAVSSVEVAEMAKVLENCSALNCW